MDIEKLKRKRQLNVQEQNALLKHSIVKEAIYWRENGIPVGLQIAFAGKGINTENCILLNYAQDFPGVSTDEGMALTPDGEFYEFEMDLNKTRTEIIDFHHWENVTSNIEINERKAGTGATWGFLALQAIAELNKC